MGESIKNIFQAYLTYLTNYLDVYKSYEPSSIDEIPSPFTFEQWLMCGKPLKVIQGIYFSGTVNYEVKDENGVTKGFMILGAREAEAIAESISAGRFTRYSNGEEA